MCTTRFSIPVTLCLLFLASACTTIVPPHAKLELLFTRIADVGPGGLTEGPAVAKDGSIYFTDIPFGENKGMILRFDPKTNQTTVFAEDSGKANGLIFDSEGYLIACEGSDGGGRQVSRWDVNSGEKTTVADSYQGKKFNAPNDLCVDDEGRIYFTDPRYLGKAPRELEHQAVYRVEKDGRVIEITHEVTKPNGIALSPDGRTLYVANHDNGTDDLDDVDAKPGPMTIYSFPLDSNGKVSGKRRTLVDYGEEVGCDGMTVDRMGNVYLTARSEKRHGVQIISPIGNEIGFIPTGAANANVGMPSNVEFGVGKERNVLYVTVDKSLYRVRLDVAGYHRQYKSDK